MKDSKLLTADVLLPIPVDEPYTYLIPEHFADLIQPGVQVVVPIANRFLAGIVMAISEKVPDERALKPIEDVVDGDPFVGDELLHLIRWIADYYICNLGEALRLLNISVNLENAVYQARKITHNGSERLTPLKQQILTLLPENEWTDVKSLGKHLPQKNFLHAIHQLKQRGLIETRYVPPQQKKIYKTVEYYRLNPQNRWSETARKRYLSPPRRVTKAHKLIVYLTGKDWIGKEELLANGGDSATIRKLLQEQVLESEARETFRESEIFFNEAIPHIDISEEQQQFIENVTPYVEEKKSFKTFLLHGITGSGKTQIYIELIRKVVSTGRQAIVLIPEIVLTPQIMNRFRHYFGEQVAAIHSKLSKGERAEVLQRCREGKISVVIGPRSAAFAPFKNLGIIIVDEEHESSYKQSDAVPRYNGRDVALYRAFLNKIPVVLGSATPSLESLFNAKTGKYDYFHLSQRISQRNLPRTQLVDIKEQWFKGSEQPLFSDLLLLKMEARLFSREQAMILHNRRGYSPYVICDECGYVERCRNCDITLTYHNYGKDLRCHYCGFSQPAPTLCPNCKGMAIIFKGVGTQRVEEEVKERFPHARVLRMDQDTTRKRHDHAKILENFRNYKADFLIGTKMIAKGLDFARVTLVGIVNADQGLNFPDFRAVEKTFQLLVQASGRAGRGANSGEVVIQTFDPQHYIFQFLLTHDYLKFYNKEIQSRKELNYPPFSRLCLIRVAGEDETTVLIHAQQIAKFLWQHNKANKYQVLGPAPAPLAKIKSQYRYHILVKQSREVDASMSYVRHLLKSGIYQNPDLKKWPVTIQIDMDPLEIL
jgi:primosomal protein N' (replication factor Y)